MKIGSIQFDHPTALAPMAGMTDTAFRRLVKRRGGCGLVVSEMVSSEGLVRGIDRTLEYAEFTEEERPVSIQIFGGDPKVMADAAQVVESMGADIVDVNMGCPVPKIAKHHAGCSLMREPAHAASIIDAMVRAVKIPVTVKMRAGWNDQQINAPELARRVADVGASAVAVHGRTAAQSYTGESDWTLIERIAADLSIPVFGSGDCVEAPQIVSRLDGRVSGVLIGRGALRNPWIFAQAASARAGAGVAPVPAEARGQFLLEYIDLLLTDVADERAGFRHVAPSFGKAPSYTKASDGRPFYAKASDGKPDGQPERGARSRERWVVNKLRALGSWYTKGLDGGSQLRIAINSAESVDRLREIIRTFFFVRPSASEAAPAPAPQPAHL